MNDWHAIQSKTRVISNWSMPTCHDLIFIVIYGDAYEILVSKSYSYPFEFGQKCLINRKVNFDSWTWKIHGVAVSWWQLAKRLSQFWRID